MQKLLFITLFSVLPLLASDSDWDASIHNTEKVSFQVQTYIDGFDIPWGMAFMPDKRMLVTDRIGDIWIVAKDGTNKVKVIGEVPS
ncbi:MAG: PQQ-dependent sugar dehydrogenase, partial [Candidatus Marinimicrobia bacterium]|nr:PQQ-dependent sugar dehydrogenase [Candidatus Neomarinimicrobiota bacterium]